MKDFFGLMLFVLTITSCQTKETPNMLSREINNNWTYQQVKGEYSGDATVPGTIHTDLFSNQQIGDPFYRLNERDQQWIDKEDWEYTTSLIITTEEVNKENMVLYFNGLDTYADVYLNDSLILEANNMFRHWEVNIKQLAKVGENKLRIFFHSPVKKGLALLEASDYGYPANNDQSENGGLGDKKISVFTRKAGYHYGWDWGPRFVTSGIWRPVVLRAWNEARINSLYIKQPSVTKNEARLAAELTVKTSKEASYKIVLLNKITGEEVARKDIDLHPGPNTISMPFNIQNPELWWSAGLGKANLYQFEAKLYSGDRELASHTATTGLRSLELIREKDEEGESFLFELNGVRLFAKGANYIPNDNFLPRVSKADYEKVIADAVKANMNMLRIWGGGIYENDYFYELCDKNGLLIWQDFMFACSMYPGDEAFLENVKQEAIENVVRLRNHPCIALWCGNNEINTAWHQYGKGGWSWKERYTPEQQEELSETYATLFHQILPKAVEIYSETDYWPSSPQAGYNAEQHASYETTSGDLHYWGVWHGLHPFEDFDKYKARFMSEYGFQSFPDFETVKKYTTEEDYNIESEVMASHQRSGIGNLRIREYMSWDYKVPADFESFLYVGQLLQARGTKIAIEAHRRAMPYCMGSLYWQINDCWPVASWSSTDYTHKWKAMHYAVKKAYEPVLLTAFAQDDQLSVYGVSDLLVDINGQLHLSLVDFDGQILWENKTTLTLKSNTSKVLSELSLKELIGNHDKNKILLKMQFESDEISSDNLFFFSKPKDQLLPTAKLKHELLRQDGQWILKIETDKLARNVYVNFKDQDISCSDNYFDLLPGESQTLILSGAEPDESLLQILSLEQIRN